jgi:serine/threonine protein kinase
MREPSSLQLYMAAVSLPSDEARSFVVESSCSDETKQEVLARLSVSTADLPHVQKWRVGSAIGHYVITGELGRGGMGVVYSARDTCLGREVALKFLSRQTIQDHAVDLLEHEARTGSSLNHPNIVTVHEVIRSQVNELYLELCRVKRREERGYEVPDSLTYQVRSVPMITRFARSSSGTARSRAWVQQDRCHTVLYLPGTGSVCIIDMHNRHA